MSFQEQQQLEQAVKTGEKKPIGGEQDKLMATVDSE